MAIEVKNVKRLIILASAFSFGSSSWLISAQVANASENVQADAVYEIGELFELGIQLSYLLLLLGLLGVGTFFVIRQVLVRRELDLSAKELQVRARLFLFVHLMKTLHFLDSPAIIFWIENYFFNHRPVFLCFSISGASEKW